MKSACQTVGANYTAKELIQGLTRSKFQDELSASLEKQIQSRNVHILLALIRNVSVKDKTGQDATGGLMATIQRANIEVENQLTFKQKTQTAMTKAKLDAEQKLVDVARETVTGDTSVKVANLLADGQKKAAELDAQRQLEVASVQLEIATLDAKSTLILGKANADVERLKNEAQAKGAELLVHVPEHVRARDAGVVGARPVHHRHLQPLGLRLARPCHVHVHAVVAPVAVGVEVRLHPEVLPDPLRGIGEGRNDLGHAVHEDRPGLRRLRGVLRAERCGAEQGEREDEGGAAGA